MDWRKIINDEINPWEERSKTKQDIFIKQINAEAEYLRSCVRLEIGPLVEWMPSHETTVTPFAAEKYPDIFLPKETSVLTIDVERTVWENSLSYIKLQTSLEEKHCLPDTQDIYMMSIIWVIHG